MSNAAAFKATYADWKLIKTRSVVQVVFEVPVEQAGLAYEVLDGMPKPGSEVWCAVARLEAAKESAAEPRQQTPSVAAPAGGAHTKKSWREMEPAQQAGVLCNDGAFRRFLAEYLKFDGIAVLDLDMAAEAVRDHCAVPSRKDIKRGTCAGDCWANLVNEYRIWMREPAVVG